MTLIIHSATVLLSNLILIALTLAARTVGPLKTEVSHNDNNDNEIHSNLATNYYSNNHYTDDNDEYNDDNYYNRVKNRYKDKMRANLFEQTVSYVEAHNSNPNRTHDLEVNHLADWTNDELDSLMGYRTNDDLPEDKDWRHEEGVVGPVGNQGSCGSCWAFSVVGMLEGQERKLNTTLRKIVQLSQQQLIDCNLEDRGCKGGRFLTSLAYIEQAGGLQTFRDYPYESGRSGNRTESKCRFDETKAFPSTRYLNGTRRLTYGDEELLKRVVAHYGPVSVAVDASHMEFRLYKKGIHYDENCTTNYTHSMLLVGYGRTASGQDYWIVRNSWGKSWGLAGYILMARNRSNNCGIASNPVISLANFPQTDDNINNQEYYQ